MCVSTADLDLVSCSVPDVSYPLTTCSCENKQLEKKGPSIARHREVLHLTLINQDGFPQTNQI